MPINLVIQEKRKALGLTQEQVAEFLTVSTPAVSKWETGASCPDVSLLAPLARLLKTDLNTLMCFDEGLSPADVPQFCQKLRDIAKNLGIGAAFEAAQQELRMYPHNEQLHLTLTMVLDNLLLLSGAETEAFDAKITAWYRALADSPEEAIRHSATAMLVSRHISRGELEEAQKLLDAMPDKSQLTQNLPDKLMLQVVIDLRNGKSEKAAEALQTALLTAVNRVSLLLAKLVDVELTAGNREMANLIAQTYEAMADLFDLPKFSSYSCSLQIAFQEQDAQRSLYLLREMLETLRRPWDMRNAPLFRRIPGTVSTHTPEMLMEAMVESLETDPDCAFLRNTPGFRALMAEYRGV